MVFNKQKLIKAAMSMEQDEFDLVALLNNYDFGKVVKTEKHIDAWQVLELISILSGYSKNELKSKRRTNELSNWRHVAMFLIYNYTTLTLSQIGDMFDNRKHDNVHYAKERIKSALEGYNQELASVYEIAENVFKIQFNL